MHNCHKEEKKKIKKLLRGKFTISRQLQALSPSFSQHFYDKKSPSPLQFMKMKSVNMGLKPD